MGINKLVDMFMGNPQPLEQKVQRDQQGQPPGGLPKDLEEAIALQKIQQKRNAMQNQQAMQAGGPQSTIVDKLRQMLAPKPQMQGRPPEMAQQGMPQGAPQGMPQAAPEMPPQGMPVQAAHGGHLAQLMSNLGQHYGGGGIVAFATGNKVEGSEPTEAELEAQRKEDRAKLDALTRFLGKTGGEFAGKGAAALADIATLIPRGLAGAVDTALIRPARAMGADVGYLSPALTPGAQNPDTPTPFYDRYIRAKEEKEASAPAEVERGRPTMVNDPRLRNAPSPQALALLAAAQKQKQQQAAAPAAPQIPGTPYDRTDATRRVDFPQVSEESQIIQERMRQDPEEKRRAVINRINEMIGEPDNKAILETIAALKAKREKAQASADPLMDLLGGIASAKPGQKWWQSGVAGSEYAASKAAQREAADTAFLEQILGHQQKVADTNRAYKTQLYTASSAAADSAAKEVYDAAIASNKSKEEAAKLAQEERIRVMEMLSREKTNAATNAAHLAAAGMQKAPNYSDLQKEAFAKDWLAKPENAGKSPLEAMSAVSGMLSGRDARQATAQEALQIKREQLMANNPLYMSQYRAALTETDPAKKKRAEDILAEIERRSGLTQAPSANIPPPPPNAVKRIG